MPAPFKGREKDYESGFHYYGARYYWSELLTGWLSVDPMADKYPSISLLTPLNLRSGDGERDYIFNTMGMGDAKKELR